jgi:PPOX class probable F420-dependent enzyme
MTAADTTASASLLSERARRFLAVPHFGIVATLNPDGSPLQAVVWYVLEGDAIVFNSRVGRQWPTNIGRDRRVSFIVADAYDYLEIRGVVEIDEDPIRGQAVIAALAHRYHEDEAEAAAQVATFVQQERVTFVLRPKRVFERLRDR